MISKRIVFVGLLAGFISAGCLMVPGPRGGVSIVPILPPVVVLGPEPYYVQGEYYYYYRDNGWYYSRSRGGPWLNLPRDHYPREVRYRHEGGDRDEGRYPERHDR